jgi:hypothetical protein
MQENESVTNTLSGFLISLNIGLCGDWHLVNWNLFLLGATSLTNPLDVITVRVSVH